MRLLSTTAGHNGGIPDDTTHLIEEIADAGLRGRGGGWFPTAEKMAAVAASGRPSAVVVNAMESEPLSRKDAYLLGRAPHLVMDGAVLAARALGAERIVVAVPSAAVAGAVAQRCEVAVLPHRYLSGQESALVNRLNGGPGLPTSTRPYVRGLDGRPTMVGNAETFAHIALIARHGAAWFRAAGTPRAPGTMLLTVGGSRVVEAPVGTRLADLVAAPAVLLGGYGGAWVRPAGVTLDPDEVPVGPGIVYGLPDGACGLDLTARMIDHLAAARARQCGPCTYGLAAVAADFGEVVRGGTAAHRRLRDRLRLLPGRGACALPDGASRLTASALDVFAEEVQLHRQRRCAAAVVEVA